jgi:glycosyltransferase involved in cell wall biosynthesis
MNICMMTNTYLPHIGGVARSVHTFAEDLRRASHRVLIVAPTYPGDELPAKVEQHVVRLPSIEQFNDSDFSVRLPLTWMLNPVLQEFQPDIVHSHHPYLIGDSALRYAASKNAPVIFTHHTLHEEYTHNMPFNSTALKKFVVELCTRYANLCDAVIAPSESIAQLIKKRGVTAPVEIIPTGIDVRAFASGDGRRFREGHGIPARTFVVGHLGRLAREKNLGYLGRAVCRFLKTAKNARFLVVGSGPSEDKLQRLFKREGLLDRLVLSGKKTGQDLYDAYAAMDVFAFSSHTETQGMVLVEAMAAGLPVVALDASGVREVVRDGENGFLLNAKASEEEFAAHLRKIQRSPLRRRRFRTGARRTAARFSKERAVAKLLDLYKRTRKASRRRRSEAEQNGFRALLNRLEVEWDLVSEKADAVVKAFEASFGTTS